MNRGLFINHLINQDCYPDEECDSDAFFHVYHGWRNVQEGEDQESQDQDK